MIAATVVRLLLVCAYGVPIALALDRRLRGAELIGAGFLTGAGAITLVMFVLSLFHVAWSRTAIVLAALPLLLIAIPFARKPKFESLSPFDLLIAIPVLGHAFFATWTSLYEWDFFGIWGFKGRTFFDADGIDWRWLEGSISHPDYPLFVPLMYDFVSIAGGRWDERSIGIVFTFLCAAVILVARTELGSIATLAIVFPALNLWIGLAEGAVMAFGCAALIVIRRGDMTLGAVLLGFAAWSKNEGLALLGVTIVALVISRRRRDALRMWPGVAIVAPWLITRAVLKLQTDFTQGGMLRRMWSRIVHPGETLDAFLNAPPDQPLFWIAVLLCIAIYARIAFTRERFLICALFMQIALFLVQGIATAADIAPHVSLTLNRLPQQLAPAAAFLAVVLLIGSSSGASRFDATTAC